MAFELVYENDFSAPLGAEWYRYKGVPACCPTSKWDEQNAVVKSGNLVLRGLRQPDGSYHTAGVSLPSVHEYGGAETLPSLPVALASSPDAVQVSTQPGTAFSYSGGGYEILQLLVEDVTGRPFADYMRDDVLLPWE